MLAATLPRPGRSPVMRRQAAQPEPVDLGRAAYEKVATHCHFRGRVDDFQFVQEDNVLIVRGRVPSFYLKQVLQTALMKVEGIRRIDNQVDVVCCNGLSGTRDD